MDQVWIPDDNGTGRRLAILRGIDGDFYISTLENGDRFNPCSVRICTGQGNPRHRNLHNYLKKAFEEAIRLEYAEGVK